MAKKNVKTPALSWTKIFLIVIVIVIVKVGYDDLASEGNPFTTFLFKIRAPYLDQGYLRSVRPTSFRMNDGAHSESIDVARETFSLDIKFRYPQVEYFGEVLSRSDLNKLLTSQFESVEQRAISAFKVDAEARIASKDILPGFGNQPAKMTIDGDVSYFSKSVISIRYSVEWSFGGSKTLYKRDAVYGIAIDVAKGRVLQLRDVVGYPYPDFATRIWDKARIGIQEQQLDQNNFKLYNDEPEFYISPASLILVQLSDRVDNAGVEVRIPFRDNKNLFRHDGPIGGVANPKI